MAEIKWRYCAVGNIVRSHVDDNGILRYGTSAYSGGTKVWLCGKYWDRTYPKIGVLGLCRGKRYYFSAVPVSLIENVRCQKLYKPSVLELMNDFEYTDDWWYDTPEDKAEIERFLAEWHGSDK